MAGKISEQTNVFTNLTTATKVAAAQGTTSGAVQLGTAARSAITDFPTKAEGAAGVPVADAAGNFTAPKNVETALAQLAARVAALEAVDLAEVATSGDYDDLSDLPPVRAVTMTDSSTTGTVKIAPVLGTPVLNAVPVFNAAGQIEPKTPTEAKVTLGLTDPEIVDAINRALGSTTWQGGGGSVAVPSQPGSGDWTLTDPGLNGKLRITLTTLPANGGSALTAGQYELNSSGTWTAIAGWDAPSETGAFDISGLTNGTSYSVKIRFNNTNGSGVASAAKSATPTNPAYTPVFVANGGSASLLIPYNQIGADSAFFTVGLTGKMHTAATGNKNIFENGANRFMVAYDTHPSNLRFDIRAYNSSSVVVGRWVVKYPLDTQFTLVASGDMSIPAVDIWLNGAALANTGDGATGYQQFEFTTGVIDWFRTVGQDAKLTGFSVNMDIAEFFLDTQRRLSPVLFHDGTHKDWSSITGGHVNLGHGMTAAQWNAPTSHNLGSATGVVLSSGTYTAA